MALTPTALFWFMAALEIAFIDAFRSDYTYLEATRGYYKYNHEEANWTDARSVCQSEGAALFHPNHEPELNQVLSALDIGRYVLHTGISDLETVKDYKTVDGRSISQVYNKWKPSEPYSGLYNQYRCGCLDSDTHYLVVQDCNYSRPYICKYHQSMKEVETTTIGGVETIVDTASDRYATLLTRLVEAVEAMQRQDANQAASLAKQTKVMHQLAANQTAAAERQALALEKLASLQEDNR